MRITTVNDYVEMVHEKFPELTNDEIKRILVYGWKLVILYVSAGNDVSSVTNKDFFFVGQIPTTGLSTFKRYCYKLQKRIAYMFKRTKSKWDGYYYFTRSEKLYLEYLSLNKRKIKVFKDVFLYKLLELLRIKEHSAPYIFRLSEDKTNRSMKYYPEIRTKNAELIEVRDALRMEDIMTSCNKFKYLQQ